MYINYLYKALSILRSMSSLHILITCDGCAIHTTERTPPALPFCAGFADFIGAYRRRAIPG